MEAQIERLAEREADLRHQLMEAQLDQWYARIEDLEVQAHLGAMETSDRVRELLGQARSRWTEARVKVDDAKGAASDVVGSFRSGIEDLFRDIRRAIVEAPAKVRG